MKAFWSYLGQGIAYALIILSIGGCYYLCERKNPNTPLIQINSTLTLTNTPAIVK